MSESIQAGSVVVLKSGGPRLTVASILTPANNVLTADCQWFHETELKSGHIPVESLKLYTGPYGR